MSDTILKPSSIKYAAKTAIFNEDGKILVLIRSETDPSRPGGLDFPGGEVDPGEDILAGASREILEETGIVITPQNLEMVYASASDKKSDSRAMLRFLCVARVKKPIVQLSFEHSAYEWWSLEEVLKRFETISWAKGLRFALKNQILR